MCSPSTTWTSDRGGLVTAGTSSALSAGDWTGWKKEKRRERRSLGDVECRVVVVPYTTVRGMGRRVACSGADE